MKTRRIDSLTILYDDRCGFCRHCAYWLSKQNTFLKLELLSSRSSEVAARYPTLASRAGAELLVVDNHGGVYVEGDAWIMCLYALKAYRRWSFRLASELLRPFARKMFAILSRNRLSISRYLFRLSDQHVASQLASCTERDVC